MVLGMMIMSDEIIVKVQRMFPNCSKYKKCCADSGTEEMMEKFDKLKKEPVTITPITRSLFKQIKKIAPEKENPFPDGENW